MKEIIGKRFDEVFDLQMGKTPDRKNTLYFEGDNVWVSIRDMSNKDICESQEHISDDAIVNCAIKKVKAGTVIMSFKLTVGKCAIAAVDLYTNEAIMAFNLKDGYYIDSSFLYYYLQSYKWQGANKAVMGLTLNKATISKQIISIPPLPIQQKIVAELDTVCLIIDKKKQQLKELDKLAQAIFYDMFGDPVENEKGWEVKKLEEIVSETCSISYGIVQPGDGVEEGVPIVRPIDMSETFVYRTGLKQTTKEISDSYKRTILKGDEILLCVRGTTGVVALASPELKECNVTRGITPITCNKQNNRCFIYSQLKMNSVQQYIADYTKGIALKQINMSDVRKIPLIVPPLSLQQSFATKIEAIEKQKELISRSIKEAQTLFDERMDYWFD